MYRRKIQLIAGTTYSLSLPKEWILKNKLKEKNEMLIQEKDDGSLIISQDFMKKKRVDEIHINIDDCSEEINQKLFSVYYLGIENISLSSKKTLTKDIKAKIRNTLTYMSGTETIYEDKKTIKIKVLLDKTKIDIRQILYRINLLIESSFLNFLNKIDKYELRINENEIDRLYHLTAKIIHLSLVDSNILQTSQIKNASLTPFYFLISKKMENIGDLIFELSKYLRKNNKDLRDKKEIINFFIKEINRSIKHIQNPGEKLVKAESNILKNIEEQINNMKDPIIKSSLKDVLRYIVDIGEETINISFYKQLLKQRNI